MLLAGLQTLSAQINLEHTFDGNVSYAGDFYPVINLYTATTNEVGLYNEDYSVYKTIPITPPDGYTIFQTYCFNKNIMTTDDKVSFIVNFRQRAMESNFNLYSTCRLYDEDGNIVKGFGYTYSFLSSIHRISNNEYRFIAYALYIYIYMTLRYKVH